MGGDSQTAMPKMTLRSIRRRVGVFLKVGVVHPLEEVPGLPCGMEGIGRVCGKLNCLRQDRIILSIVWHIL